MELRRIRYFLAVAEHANFHRAAEALHVAQSALSRHVQALSRQVGGPLFERTPGGVRLTFLGQQLYGEAWPLLKQLDDVYERARRTVDGEFGRLTVGVSDLGARNFLARRAIHLCRTRHPGIELDFVAMNSSEQIADLQAGKLDAGVVVERPSHQADLEHLPLGADPFMLALRVDHPLARRDRLQARELSDERFIAVKLGIYQLAQSKLWAGCRDIGLEPRIFQEVPTEQMQLALIGEGMGLGFVNGSVAESLPASLVLKPVNDLHIRLQVDLVWSPARADSPVRHLVSSFRDVCREQAPPPAPPWEPEQARGRRRPAARRSP